MFTLQWKFVWFPRMFQVLNRCKFRLELVLEVLINALFLNMYKFINTPNFPISKIVQIIVDYYPTPELQKSALLIPRTDSKIENSRFPDCYRYLNGLTWSFGVCPSILPFSSSSADNLANFTFSRSLFRSRRAFLIFSSTRGLRAFFSAFANATSAICCIRMRSASRSRAAFRLAIFSSWYFRSFSFLSRISCSTSSVNPRSSSHSSRTSL